MPRPTKFVYKKKEPFRDSSFFIVICEGQNREPDYFRFFEGISPRVKIVAVESIGGNSAPQKLVENALSKELELEIDPNSDRLWFVIDTDRWRHLIHELRGECSRRQHWKVAQSNPCFEVWLYYHAKGVLPPLSEIEKCKSWKPFIPTVIKGGFNPEMHPVAIETAIMHAKASYRAEGYSPTPGSTQLWQLGEELLPMIIKSFNELKHRFPIPEVMV